jgi:hypothetical protein
MKRPWAVTALSFLFGLGAGATLASGMSLLTPGGPLEPMWRVNPGAREAFGRMGLAGPVLMATLSAACASATAGLWRGKPWGYQAAVALLGLNLLTAIANVLTGADPSARIGIPIVAALLAFLTSRHVRSYFRS